MPNDLNQVKHLFSDAPLLGVVILAIIILLSTFTTLAFRMIKIVLQQRDLAFTNFAKELAKERKARDKSETRFIDVLDRRNHKLEGLHKQYGDENRIWAMALLHNIGTKREDEKLQPEDVIKMVKEGKTAQDLIVENQGEHKKK